MSKPRCGDCDRRFVDRQALQQHLQYSPAHALTFDCDDCDRSFSSEDALQQHLRDSPVHAPSFDCNDCDRSFSSEDALQQHLATSKAHMNQSPIDSFFAEYVDFDYDAQATPSDEWRRLQEAYGWQRGNEDGRAAWEEYSEALVLEFESWYGNDNNSLSSWRSLCRAVRIQPIPETCGDCQRALRGRHVNMVDLVQHKRNGGDQVQIFDTLDELREYTAESRRIFPRFTIKRGALLENLLRHIFSVA